MAVHWEPEPPRTLAAWHRFQEECWRQQRYDWLPKDWEPEDFSDPSRDDITEARWVAVAKDHPYKGQSWCWRCIAEAHGAPVAHIPHVKREDAICWRAAEGNPGTEDAVQDSRPPGDESTSDWTEAGRRYVAEGVDTGTFFYTPPPKPASAPRRQVVEGATLRITRLDEEGRPVGESQVVAGPGAAGLWLGFEDDAEAEPVRPDFPEWSALYAAGPVPADQLRSFYDSVPAAAERQAPGAPPELETPGAVQADPGADAVADGTRATDPQRPSSPGGDRG